VSRRRRPCSSNPARNVRLIPHTQTVAHTQYPNWTTHGHRTLDDLYWISTRAGIETGRSWVHGITQTLSWLAGRAHAPITARDAQPVTRALAEAERWAALAVGDPLLPLGSVYRQLDVPPILPRAGLDAEFVSGVWKTLSWILNVNNAKIPFDIPRRDEQGHVPTGAQRYAETLTRYGDFRLLPEDRQTLRASLDREAAHDAILADIIEDTRRSIAS
jgi:hypothetical protein